MLQSRRAARMSRHHDRSRRAGLNMISLMDIFTILVFFLLFSSTEEVEVLPEPRELSLPESVATVRGRESLVVSVGPAEVRVAGEVLLTTQELLAAPGQEVPALALALAEHYPEDGAPLEVTVMGDESLSYEVLRRVLASCAAARFERVSLAVRSRAVASATTEASDASG